MIAHDAILRLCVNCETRSNHDTSRLRRAAGVAARAGPRQSSQAAPRGCGRKARAKETVPPFHPGTRAQAAPARTTAPWYRLRCARRTPPAPSTPQLHFQQFSRS
jgi:hypothetical protein